MKRILALLLLACLVTSPALAFAQESSKAEAGVAATSAVDRPNLKEAVVTAAHEMVVKEEAKAPLATPQSVPGRAGAGWRTAIGIAMLAGGAAIIWKGVDIYQDEPDRYGRVKNSDSFLAYGVGAGIMTFGFITLKGGLEGRGF